MHHHDEVMHASRGQPFVAPFTIGFDHLTTHILDNHDLLLIEELQEAVEPVCVLPVSEGRSVTLLYRSQISAAECADLRRFRVQLLAPGLVLDPHSLHPRFRQIRVPEIVAAVGSATASSPPARTGSLLPRLSRP